LSFAAGDFRDYPGHGQHRHDGYSAKPHDGGGVGWWRARGVDSLRGVLLSEAIFDPIN
jgi:hypothetical protein